MRRRTWAAAAAVTVTGAVAVAIAVASAGGSAAPAADDPAPATVTVTRGDVQATIGLTGVLTYRARPDGSPYVAINHAPGTYTGLPAEGAEVGCGDVLYRVDDEPVLLLCGPVPLYRDLAPGDEGRDVRQLNRALGVPGDAFTARTARALARLQARQGAQVTGELRRRDAVVLPRAVRIATVTARLGAPARPGAEVVRATSRRLEVRVDLDAGRRREVRPGDRALVTLPGNRAAAGRVARIGRVARTAGEDDEVAHATVPAFIRLGRPRRAGGLDRAPVRVEITTAGAEDVLSVPVVALVGRAGGGLAVEVVRPGGRRELVAVRTGLFDARGGRVAVEGELREGDRVVVPSP
jgi:hypothetical protein